MYVWGETMKENRKVLVVDDDSGHRTMLRTLLAGWGYQVQAADDGNTGVDAIRSEPFDIVLMDMKMLRMSGMEALEKIVEYNPSLPVIIMTAYSSVDTAVEALKNGASDYLTKPLDFEKLRLTMDRILETIYLKNENQSLRRSLGREFRRESIIGKSPSMVALLDTVELAAPSNANILITGESGTGKELVAGAIHHNSPRRNEPFVRINCAAITETLLESELFGHEKGAFTGADRKRAGRFQQAHRGSILLDEIGEMSLAMQAKLLRVIQEKEITPVGGEGTVKVDVRVIAATNRNLRELTSQGKFREDLFFRLNVVTLEIPPLRKRPEDIPELALHFLDSFARKNQREIRGFTPEAMDALIRHPWPGNVRELMNSIERAVVLARGDYLSLGDFPLIPRRDCSREDAPVPESGSVPLSEIERRAVLATLSDAAGNRSEAARRLGITRKTLLKKLKEYGQA
jgi:two-component system response regulator HydG